MNQKRAKQLRREANRIVMSAAVKSDFKKHVKRLHKRMKSDYKKKEGGFSGRH